MRVFNRHVSMRGLTVFGFETVLISASIVVAAQLHGTFDRAMSGLWKVVLVTALCELCSDYTAGPLYVRQHDVLGNAADIDRIVAMRQVDRIVVSLTDRRGHLPFEALLRAKLAGVRIEDAVTTFERLTGKILVEDLKPSGLIFSDGFRVSRLTRAAKRAFDLVCALVVFVLSAPAMLL